MESLDKLLGEYSPSEFEKDLENLNVPEKRKNLINQEYRIMYKGVTFGVTEETVKEEECQWAISKLYQFWQNYVKEDERYMI